jgi:hypothetical protein
MKLIRINNLVNCKDNMQVMCIIDNVHIIHDAVLSVKDGFVFVCNGVIGSPNFECDDKKNYRYSYCIGYIKDNDSIICAEYDLYLCSHDGVGDEVCPDCCGDGYTYSYFIEKKLICHVCKGTGLIPYGTAQWFHELQDYRQLKYDILHTELVDKLNSAIDLWKKEHVMPKIEEM